MSINNVSDIKEETIENIELEVKKLTISQEFSKRIGNIQNYLRDVMVNDNILKYPLLEIENAIKELEAYRNILVQNRKQLQLIVKELISRQKQVFGDEGVKIYLLNNKATSGISLNYEIISQIDKTLVNIEQQMQINKVNINKQEIKEKLEQRNVSNHDWKVLNRIKDVLNELGLEQTWLAEKVEMNRSTISELINNKSQTSMSNAFKIAYVLNKPINELFYVSSQLIWEDLQNDKKEYYQMDEEDYINNIYIKIHGKKVSTKIVTDLFEELGEIKKIQVENERLEIDASQKNSIYELIKKEYGSIENFIKEIDARSEEKV